MTVIKTAGRVTNAYNWSIQHFAAIAHRTRKGSAKVKTESRVPVVSESASDAARVGYDIGHKMLPAFASLSQPHLGVFGIQVIKNAEPAPFSSHSAGFDSSERHFGGREEQIVDSDHAC